MATLNHLDEQIVRRPVMRALAIGCAFEVTYWPSREATLTPAIASAFKTDSMSLTRRRRQRPGS